MNKSVPFPSLALPSSPALNCTHFYSITLFVYFLFLGGGGEVKRRLFDCHICPNQDFTLYLLFM